VRFLIILVGAILRRRMDARRQGDPDRVLRQLIARVPSAWVRYPRWVLAVPALLCIVLGAADIYAMHRTWFLIWLPVELLLLVGAMGNPGWHDSLKAYAQAWQRHDIQSAWHHVRHLVPASRQGLATTPERLHLILASRLLVTTFDGYFLIVFWFALTGPAGAVFVRLLMALRDHWPEADGRSRFAAVYAWLAWAPMHLLSMTFALSGDFSGWVARHHRHPAADVVDSTGADPTEATLFSGANGALSSYSLEPERFASLHPDEWQDYGRRSLAAVRDLLNRSMLVWIGFLALLAIAGLV